jgi:signal peptidase II
MMLRLLWVSLAVILLDQGTKVWIQAVFEPYESLPVLPFFNLVLVFNTGAAFSFLGDASGWQRWFFIALALVVSLVLLAWLRRLGEGERLTGWGLVLVLGGAVGNLIDRVLLGHVVDFLDFHWAGWHWPAFNVADMAITCGVALLLLDGFLPRKSTA